MARVAKRGRGRPPKRRRAAPSKATSFTPVATDNEVDNDLGGIRPIVSTPTSGGSANDAKTDALPRDGPSSNNDDAVDFSTASEAVGSRDDSSYMSTARERIQRRIDDVRQCCFSVKRDIDKILEDVPVDSVERESIIVEAHEAVVACSKILWGLNFWCPSRD